VFSSHDMLSVAQASAADVVSLKLVKHAGLSNLRNVAVVAEAAGIGLYGGCLLESSIGAAAHLHAFAGLRSLDWGCEHFGPQILTAGASALRRLSRPSAGRGGDRRDARPRQAAPLRAAVGDQNAVLRPRRGVVPRNCSVRASGVTCGASREGAGKTLPTLRRRVGRSHEPAG
jgi:hypothetical protein